MQPENSSQSSSHPIVAKLEAAAHDLLFISETDAPLTPFFWPSDAQECTPELLAQLAKLPQGAKIGTQTPADFFRPVTAEEDWMNADEKAEVRRFQELTKALEANLNDILVYRIGETNIDIYVVGKTEGGFAGLKTNVVET